ncbi:hypothetical protein ACO0K2_19540 [Undibacterium sp. MH2W]|uniref:hypothetical protein n=1 Tax=Undibacterium sp. MH2W TaxID=3413044 RepID=UPI003BF037C2
MIHQSRRIYDSARSYLALAEPAFHDDSILVPNVMAVVANLALCVELLLKACDAKVTKPNQSNNEQVLVNGEISSNVWGHDLVQIFSKLNPEVQETLVLLFESETNQQLRPLLEKCKDYFTHARYFYESKHAHIFSPSDIRILAHGINAAILKSFG